MGKKKESVVLTAEYITILVAVCNKVREQEGVPNLQKIPLRNQVYLIIEVLEIYKEKYPNIVQKYLDGKIPAIVTINRSLNKKSPKENCCSKRMKSMYDTIIEMYSSEGVSAHENTTPKAQQLYWSVNFGNKLPGAYINGRDGEFIEWVTLKEEITNQVINSLPAIIKIPANLKLLNHFGKENG